MTIDVNSIYAQLRELDAVLSELSKHKSLTESDIEVNLSQRWIIERGLIAASSLIFNISNQILASHFGIYPDTYESHLTLLNQKDVISASLYTKLKGLGGFRNILVHEYVRISTNEVHKSFIRGLAAFPEFAKEIVNWLSGLQRE